MTNQDMILDVMRAQGKADALELRGRSADMDGTALIAEESKVPAFDPAKDYSGWTRGAPVRDAGQLYGLLQPYNAANYQGRPADLPALWSVKHTKDPARAKAWVQPLGTSGMYMLSECYVAEDGTVWRALKDNLVYTAKDYPQGWEVAIND